MTEKADCFQILAPAIDVRNPFTLPAAVVAIKHGRHRIDAQPVDMKMLQPIERAGDQKTLNFAPAEIIDVGIPVVMKSLARIEMLVERRAVEPGEAVWIGRKVRRHPVQNDADIRGMERIDEA